MKKFFQLFISLMLILQFSACNRTPEKPADQMQWWRDARFGMFIHWGLYSVPAGEWNGNTSHAEWIRTTAQIPLEEYNKFVGQFNPEKFNADEWVKMAKDAGMKYITITTKHHDGFCLFDSKETDFDIMSTPFKRDIMKEMAAACQKYGVTMCWYHSIMDWHHPDYLPRRDWEKDRSADSADYDRYITYLKNQLKELITNYGKIGVLWFDGEWESTWTHERGLDLYNYVKSLQPDIIINNRVDVGRGGMGGLNKEGGYVGDFGTPEQEIPATGIEGVDWESCMTMNDHWGYNKTDKNFKTSEDLVRKLIDIASKGGNFLLNVGPTSEGLFPQESIERLKEIGEWMKVNGDAIYGTQASPFKELPWGRCTRKADGSNTILYLHVFNWPADGKLQISGLGNKIKKISQLSSGNSLGFTQKEGEVSVDLTKAVQDKFATVLLVQIKGKPVIYDLPEIQAGSDLFLKKLSFQLTSRVPGAEIRYTIDGTDPSLESLKSTGLTEIEGQKNITVKACCYLDGKAISGIATRVFTLVTPKPAVSLQAAEPGLLCSYYEGKWDKLPDFSKMKPLKKEVYPVVKTWGKTPGTDYALLFEGYVNVPDDGIYKLFLESDDGSRLLIDDEEIINHDGLHSLTEKQADIALAAGYHKVRIEFFQGSGGEGLNIWYQHAGGPRTPVPAEAYFTNAKPL
jgi:alpha-L-fucosidase